MECLHPVVKNGHLPDQMFPVSLLTRANAFAGRWCWITVLPMRQSNPVSLLQYIRHPTDQVKCLLNCHFLASPDANAFAGRWSWIAADESKLSLPNCASRVELSCNELEFFYSSFTEISNGSWKYCYHYLTVLPRLNSVLLLHQIWIRLQ